VWPEVVDRTLGIVKGAGGIRLTVSGAVNEFVVNSVIKLAIVVDLILSVLVSASCSESDSRFFILQWRSVFKQSVDNERGLHAFPLFLVKV
jgi:hypothetical protein